MDRENNHTTSTLPPPPLGSKQNKQSKQDLKLKAGLIGQLRVNSLQIYLPNFRFLAPDED